MRIAKTVTGFIIAYPILIFIGVMIDVVLITVVPFFFAKECYERDQWFWKIKIKDKSDEEHEVEERAKHVLEHILKERKRVKKILKKYIRSWGGMDGDEYIEICNEIDEVTQGF